MEEVDEDENNNDNEKEEFGPRLNHHKRPLEDHDIFNDSRQHLTINSTEKTTMRKTMKFHISWVLFTKTVNIMA